MLQAADDAAVRKPVSKAMRCTGTMKIVETLIAKRRKIKNIPDLTAAERKQLRNSISKQIQKEIKRALGRRRQDKILNVCARCVCVQWCGVCVCKGCVCLLFEHRRRPRTATAHPSPLPKTHTHTTKSTQNRHINHKFLTHAPNTSFYTRDTRMSTKCKSHAQHQNVYEKRRKAESHCVYINICVL